MMKNIFITYPVSDIQKEVDARTSRIAVARGKAAGNPDMFDDLRLSKGESRIFGELLDNSIHQTYDWVRAFGKHFDDGIRLYGFDIKRATASETPVAFAFNGKDYIYNLPKDGVDVRDYTKSVDSSNNVTIKFDVPLIMLPKRDFRSEYNIRVTYRVLDNLDGEVMQIERTYDRKSVFQVPTSESIVKSKINHTIIFTADLSDVMDGTPDAYTFDDIVSVCITELSIMDIVSPNEIKRGTLVRYTDIHENERQFEALVDCDDQHFIPCQHREIGVLVGENDIVFHLEHTCWWDENRFGALKRNLKEALIHYIIKEWYDITLPEISEQHAEKAEEYGREALLAINAEEKHLKRKTIWL